MKKLNIVIAFVLTCLFTSSALKAQETKDNPDTLAQAIEKIQSDLLLLNKLKITGYVQAQYQKADTAGIESFAGGNFGSNLDNRFTVRRGRFKLAYTNELSQYVLQVDVTEKGVGIKDAYASFTDRWTQMFSVTGGVFDRPFGYEISYSSSSRESPERSRLFQTLFPGERELGARLTFMPPKTSRFYFFKIEGGLFNGSGPSAVEYDKYKDFIGHISLFKNIANENISLSGGASIYQGGWRQNTKYTWSTHHVTLADGSTGEAFMRDSSKVGDKTPRQYYGFDGQVTFANNPLGITTLRGEYIAGVQSGVASSSASPTAQPLTDAYIRNFKGGYFYFLQNLGKSKHQLVVKYDWYDPNTKVKGNEIGVAVLKDPNYAPTTGADIRYSTLGLGWIYRWNANVRLTFYYDIVTNETSNAASLRSSNNGATTYARDRKDNVLTLRLQYKF